MIGLISQCPQLAAINTTVDMFQICFLIQSNHLLRNIFINIANDLNSIAIKLFDYTNLTLQKMERENKQKYTAVMSCITFDFYAFVDLYREQLFLESKKQKIPFMLPSISIWDAESQAVNEQPHCSQQFPGVFTNLPGLRKKTSLLPTPIKFSNIIKEQSGEFKDMIKSLKKELMTGIVTNQTRWIDVHWKLFNKYKEMFNNNFSLSEIDMQHKIDCIWYTINDHITGRYPISNMSLDEDIKVSD